MAKKRLVNCDFLNSGSFAQLTNNAKLLYMFMLTNADDKGFCDRTELIMENLQIGNDALSELVNKGLLFQFKGNYENCVYLIRHWYYHNQYRDKLYTTYYKFLKKVILEDNKYMIKKEETIIKEDNKLKETKINEIKLNEIKEDDEFEDDLPFPIKKGE